MTTDFLNLIPDEVGYIENYKNINSLSLIGNTNISIPILCKNNMKNKMQSWYVNKIRNCIAHQNIEAINENQKWEKVRMWNINPSMGRDFEVIYDCYLLKQFGIYIAQLFMNKNI